MARGGRFDRQISIERIAVNGDEGYVAPDASYGTPNEVWVPLVAQVGSPAIAERFWAEVQDVMPSRSEAVRQGLVVALNQTRIRMRWRSDVTSAMRVVVHGETDVTYQIVAGPAEIGGRKDCIEIMAEKVTT